MRAAAGRAGRSLGLLIDLQGPKLRLSGDTVERRVQVGEEIVFTGASALAGTGSACTSSSATSTAW